MEKEGHVVRVCDLPLDISESRLSDKLHIHFLRRRNGGGGDISSISVSKTPPGSALITFEDREVAQRVVDHGIHTLQVGEKQYAVTASLHKEEIHADDLFVDSAVTVDYSKLPGGKAALSNILMSFPDVTFTFHPLHHMCTLKGGYSRVCALTNTLLGRLDPRKPPDSQPLNTAVSGQKTHCDSEEIEAPWQTGFSEQVSGLNPLEHVHRASDPPFSTNGSKDDETLVKRSSQEDFSMVKGTSQEDFSVVKGTSQEDFSMVKGTSQEDFSVVKGTSQEDFSMVKGTSQEDFSMVKRSSQDDFSMVKRSSQDNLSMVKRSSQDDFSMVKRMKRSSQDNFSMVKRSSQDNFSMVKSSSQDNFSMVKSSSQDDFSMVKRSSQDNFSMVKGTSQEDFSMVKRSSQEDFSMEKGTSQEDFSMVKRSSQEDFSMVKGTSQEDFSMVKRSSQEDFSMVKGTSQEDFSVVKGTSQEDFSVVKGTSQEDFSVVKGTSQEDFSVVKGTSQDDFSMVIDSDIFVYIQKHCSEDYWSILDRHGVEVLDVPTSDITTLYLQLKTEAVRRGRGDVSRAHIELSSLYQEKEAQLRREILPKAALLPQGFQEALEVLKYNFPKLLINEDKANIYLVGSGRDVSEAKKFLMDSKGTTKDHNQDKKKSFREEKLKGGSKSYLAARFEKGMSAEKPTSILEHRPFQDEHNGKSLSEKHTRESSNPKDRRFLGEDILFKEAEPKHNRKPLATFAPSDSVKNAANSGEIQSNSLDTADLSRHNGEEFPTASGSQSESGHTLRQTNSFSGPVRPKQGHKEKISEKDLPLITNEGLYLKHSHYPDVHEVLSIEVKVPFFQWLYTKHFQLNEIEDIISDVKMTETQTRNDMTLLLTGADAATVRVSQERLNELINEIAKEFTTNELSLASLGVLDSRSETVERQCRATRERFVRVQIIPLLKHIFFLGPKLECLEAMSALKEWSPNGTGGRKSPERGHLGEPSSTTSTDYSLRFSSTSLPSEAGGEEERDQPQCLKYKQDEETDSIYSGEGISLKNDACPSEHVQGDKEQKAPEPSDLSEWKGLKDTPVQQKISQPPLEENQNGSSAPQSDNATNQTFFVKTSEKSLPLSVLSSQTHSPADTPDISCGEGATHNQDAFLEEHGDVESPSTTSGGTDACPWCKGQVNPYCSVCPKSERAGPQSPSNKHYEGNVFEDQQEDQMEKSGLWCVCGIMGRSVSMMASGVALCPTCQEKSREEKLPDVRGTMTRSKMSLSLPGHNKHTTLRISYTTPDGIQGATHPNPGSPTCP